jgi:hypothetical protein
MESSSELKNGFVCRSYKEVQNQIYLIESSNDESLSDKIVGSILTIYTKNTRIHQPIITK